MRHELVRLIKKDSYITLMMKEYEHDEEIYVLVDKVGNPKTDIFRRKT